jgi:DNA-binding GntR family transcriptional regulator
MKTGDKSNPKADLRLAIVGRNTLNDQVYSEMRRAIAAGAIVPGTSLTIRGLAKEFGTSHMPVRDALNRLVTERVLEVLPNRTVALPLMTPERLDEICQIRIALEGALIEIGAPLASELQLKHLSELNEEMKKMRVKDARPYLVKNKEFHLALCNTARMPTGNAILESLWLQAGPFLNFGVTEMALKYGMEYHSTAVAAMYERNGRAAREAIVTDISESARQIGAIIRDKIAASSDHLLKKPVAK